MTVTAKPEAPTSCARYFRQGLRAILIIGVTLSGYTSNATEDPLFSQYEVDTGSAQRQTVLTGFLLGSGFAELAVVHVHESAERRLRIYTFKDGSWFPAIEATLRPEILFVDVANIGGHDRLISYEPGRVNWFDPELSTERTLMEVTSKYKFPRNGEIPHVDITRDINGDERDDLLVPDNDGFWVIIQTSDSAFADPVKLGPSIGMGISTESYGYRYQPWDHSRIHQMDYNRDGRSDLVFWNEDHFEVHLQDEQGLFASAAETFTTTVAFDSDDPATLAAPQGVRHRRKDHMPTADGQRQAMAGRVLHSLTDMNGDGITDLVVFSLEVASMWSAQSTYEVHFGIPTEDGGTAFASEVGTAIRSDGLPVGMESYDVDRDGQVDMLFTTIAIGKLKTIGMFIGTLLTGTVALKLNLYRMQDGLYPKQANAIRRTRVVAHGKSGQRAAIFPSVLFGDVSGDGRPDLLVQKGRKELHIYHGVPGSKMFAQRPQKVSIAMPNEEYTWLADLNRDGKQDVVMHHPVSATSHRLTILIAR